MIELRGVSHTYSPATVFEQRALIDVSLAVADGEFVGLIGHTGSGKSTLIQHLNGLLKPMAGTVLLDGEDIHAQKAALKAARRKVGLVFQYPEHQLFETTVYKDVAFGPLNHGAGKEEADARVREALAAVGVGEELYEQSPFDLSGGQKRRVAIAGVLAMKPDALVLDEPAAGLDPKGRDEILAQIRHMHTLLGITVILVSHSMEDVARLADRIVVINKGRIAFEGKPNQVFARADELAQMGLSAPQTSLLIGRLNALGCHLPPVFTPEEAAEEIYKELFGA